MCRWAAPPLAACHLFLSQSKPEAKVSAPPRGHYCHTLSPSTASGPHCGLGTLKILYILGFLPLFSDPGTYGSLWALHIVGAYYLVNEWSSGRRRCVEAEGGCERSHSRPPKPPGRLCHPEHPGSASVLRTESSSFLKAGTPPSGLIHRQVLRGSEQGPAHRGDRKGLWAGGRSPGGSITEQ